MTPETTQKINVWAIVGLTFTLVVNVAVVSYWGGRLSSDVANMQRTLDTTIKRLEGVNDRQEDRLRLLETAVGVLAGKHEPR